MDLIRRMPFPVKETFKNSSAFGLFRVRFNIGKSATWHFKKQVIAPRLRDILDPRSSAYGNDGWEQILRTNDRLTIAGQRLTIV